MSLKGCDGFQVARSDDDNASTSAATDHAAATAYPPGRSSTAIATNSRSGSTWLTRLAWHWIRYLANTWPSTALQDDTSTNNASTGYNSSSANDTGAYHTCLGGDKLGTHSRNHTKSLATIYNNHCHHHSGSNPWDTSVDHAC